MRCVLSIRLAGTSTQCVRSVRSGQEVPSASFCHGGNSPQVHRARGERLNLKVPPGMSLSSFEMSRGEDDDARRARCELPGKRRIEREQWLYAANVLKVVFGGSSFRRRKIVAEPGAIKQLLLTQLSKSREVHAVSKLALC